MTTEHDGFQLEPRDDGWSITGYMGSTAHLSIPDCVEGNPITLIAVRAFEGNRNLVSVEIPASVTFVGNYAFAGCSSLERITHSGNVTTLNLGTFWNCASLTSVELPETLTTIGDGAFRCCGSLKSVDIPRSVTALGDSAFRECPSLSSLVLDGNIQSIERSAFRDCTQLTHFAVNHTLSYLGVRAFQNCPSLKSVTILGSPIDTTLAAFRNHSNTYLVADYAVQAHLLSFEEAKTLLTSKFPPELLLAARVAASYPDRLAEIPSKQKLSVVLAENGCTEELQVLARTDGYLAPSALSKCIDAAQSAGHAATAAYLIDLLAQRTDTGASHTADAMKL